MHQESPTTRRAGSLDFTAIGGKIQRPARALIGAGGTMDSRAKHPVENTQSRIQQSF